MQLTQQETNKVKERDEQHTVELREWRVEIAKLKQVQNMGFYHLDPAISIVQHSFSILISL